MDSQKVKQVRRTRRRAGIRKRVIGTPERPRLCVYKSLNHVYAQIVDDLAGRTITSASTRDKAFGASSGTGNTAAAEAIGSLIAQKAKAAGISSVAFDRGGFRFHGRVKALADAARKGGLEF
ncbi:MAG: 50S ribosomal protein L18 [Phycisphaerales bacterium]|nr:50S ribosomal protein L18 [Phycisphaerales bacterium]